MSSGVLTYGREWTISVGFKYEVQNVKYIHLLHLLVFICKNNIIRRGATDGKCSPMTFEKMVPHTDQFEIKYTIVILPEFLDGKRCARYLDLVSKHLLSRITLAGIYCRVDTSRAEFFFRF